MIQRGSCTAAEKLLQHFCSRKFSAQCSFFSNLNCNLMCLMKSTREKIDTRLR